MRLAGLGQGSRFVDRVGQPRLYRDAVLAVDLDRDLGEIARRHEALGGVLGADEVCQVRLERCEEAFGVLVDHHAQNTDEGRELEEVLESGSGGLGAVGFVRGVEHDRRAAPGPPPTVRAR